MLLQVWREDKNLIVLVFLVVFYTLVTLFAVGQWSKEMAIVAIFSGAMGTFVGALAMMLKNDKVALPPGSTTDSSSSQHQTVVMPKESVEDQRILAHTDTSVVE